MRDIVELEPYLNHLDKYARVTGLSEGYLYGFGGHECRYVQVATSGSGPDYFAEGHQASVTLMVFDDAVCMTYTDDISNAGDRIKVLAMIYAQTQVNQQLARWYSNPDADFMTDPDELQRPSIAKLKGWCMQSRKYPYIAVAIEYFTDEGGLRSVIHDLTLPC